MSTERKGKITMDLADHDRLHERIVALREENVRLKDVRADSIWSITCIHHTDAQRKDAMQCPVCLLRERDQLREEKAELEKDKARLDWFSQLWRFEQENLLCAEDLRAMIDADLLAKHAPKGGAE